MKISTVKLVAITVHKIQPDDRQIDIQHIRFRFFPLATEP